MDALAALVEALLGGDGLAAAADAMVRGYLGLCLNCNQPLQC